MSQEDGTSSDGDSINARNPSSTGLGCYKTYEHQQQEAQRNRDELMSPQVIILLFFL